MARAWPPVPETRTARIWDAKTGKQILRLYGHDFYVLAATFSPDGARLVTGSWNNTARIWDVSGRMTPRLTFRIGVTGHLPGDRLSRGKRLAAEMAACLDAIAQAVAAFSKHAATGGAWSDAAPEIRLLSCLAEGADRIGAEAALARKWPLEAVLPFTSQEYKKDFTSPASRAAFERLCAQAKVFSLAMPGGPDERSAAYAAAGDVLLGNCDLLIAIWDGEKGRGRGGTHWMVRRALRA